MSLTIELPSPVDEELFQEAQREGIPAEEHAALLVVLAMALLRGDKPTPFQEMVRAFLSHHSLDADQAETIVQRAGRLQRSAGGDAETPGVSPADEDNAASIALLESWLEEDATDDPEEIRQAQKELDEFKQAINAERERAGARRVYP